MKKALIFCRVSSREQEESGYSLPAQKKLLEEYTLKLGFNVVKVFSISESASGSKQRKVFNEMLDYAEKHRIEALVVEKTDRLSRNIKDAVAVNEWVNEDPEHQVHFVKESFVLSKDSKSNEKFIWNIKVSVAQYYIDNLSEEVKKGQKEKLSQGWLPTRPPLGYRSVGEEGRRMHVPDEIMRPIIIEMFRTYAGGVCSLSILTDTLNAKIWPLTGMKLSISMVHRYLTNPFYIGLNTWNGQVKPGNQETFIDKNTFDKVQEILAGKVAPKVSKHSFTFKGLVKCAGCGGTITWETHKGIVYGHCNHYRECKQNKTVKDFELIEKLVPAFKALKVKDMDLLNWIRKALKESYGIESSDYSRVLSELNKREELIKSRLVSLYNDKLDGKITEAFHDERYAEYMSERSAIESQRTKLNNKDRNFYDKTSVLYEVAQKADEAFLMKKPDKKRELLQLVIRDMRLNNGEIAYNYTKNYQYLYEAVQVTNNSKISKNKELRKKILEQPDFVGVKANIKGFEIERSAWLSMSV
ncbi:recombinase family protein [candidate division WWE3 bacterium]|uniref:Recombinase family protein n=1 Tax=candidate division WWE3 bacterium TaxID=2053526 RepID=A0A7X9E661_UNCKA|nr:recombinase family protein [candidate division WWE3 bacterium]